MKTCLDAEGPGPGGLIPFSGRNECDCRQGYLDRTTPNLHRRSELGDELANGSV